MSGQVDYMTPISHEHILVGSTIGQVGVFSSINNQLVRMLVDEGLSVYEVVVTQRAKRMALACDGGMALIYETENFEKVGQVTA